MPRKTLKKDPYADFTFQFGTGLKKATTSKFETNVSTKPSTSKGQKNLETITTFVDKENEAYQKYLQSKSKPKQTKYNSDSDSSSSSTSSSEHILSQTANPKQLASPKPIKLPNQKHKKKFTKYDSSSSSSEDESHKTPKKLKMKKHNSDKAREYFRNKIKENRQENDQKNSQKQNTQNLKKNKKYTRKESSTETEDDSETESSTESETETETESTSSHKELKEQLNEFTKKNESMDSPISTTSVSDQSLISELSKIPTRPLSAKSDYSVISTLSTVPQRVSSVDEETKTQNQITDIDLKILKIQQNIAKLQKQVQSETNPTPIQKNIHLKPNQKMKIEHTDDEKMIETSEKEHEDKEKPKKEVKKKKKDKPKEKKVKEKKSKKNDKVKTEKKTKLENKSRKTKKKEQKNAKKKEITANKKVGSPKTKKVGSPKAKLDEDKVAKPPKKMNVVIKKKKHVKTQTLEAKTITPQVISLNDQSKKSVEKKKLKPHVKSKSFHGNLKPSKAKKTSSTRKIGSPKKGNELESLLEIFKQLTETEQKSKDEISKSFLDTKKRQEIIEKTNMTLGGFAVKLNHRYRIDDGRIGLCKYKGTTLFSEPSSQIYVGLRIEHGEGVNNGTVQGKSYFKAPFGKGIFVKPNRLIQDLGDYGRHLVLTDDMINNKEQNELIKKIQEIRKKQYEREKEKQLKKDKAKHDAKEFQFGDAWQPPEWINQQEDHGYNFLAQKNFYSKKQLEKV